MGLDPLDLTFDFKPIYVPRTISQFLGEVSRIGNLSDRLLKLDDYVNRLESEMGKIVAFERELPLCILLINDAILALKEEAIQFRKQYAEPVLEEFIPLKKSCDDSGKDEIKIKDKDNGDKKNWLSSTQLWKTDDDQQNTKPNQNQNQNQNSVLEIEKRVDEAPVIDNLYQPCRPSPKSLMPFKGYLSSFPAVGMRKEDKGKMPVSSGISLITPGIKNLREELRPSGLLSSKICSNKRPVSSPSSNVQPSLFAVPQPPQQQNSRKQRRCWSPELHRRFVNALQQLGGTQAATPKQIRELMQVDGLTNDEVKSHLQKYRLHTRKLPTSTTPTANQSLVLEGGLWNESSKKRNSPNGSPEGPLQLYGANEGTSTTWGDSMDEDDDKSESFSWKSHTHTSGKVEI